MRLEISRSGFLVSLLCVGPATGASAITSATGPRPTAAGARAQARHAASLSARLETRRGALAPPLRAEREPDALELLVSAVLFDGAWADSRWIELEPRLDVAIELLESGDSRGRLVALLEEAGPAPRRSRLHTPRQARELLAVRGAPSRVEPAPWDAKTPALRVLPGAGRLNQLAAALKSELDYDVFYAPGFLERIGADAAVDTAARLVFLSADAVRGDDPESAEMAHELRHIGVAALERTRTSFPLMGAIREDAAAIIPSVRATGAGYLNFDEPEAYAAGVRRAAERLQRAIDATDAARARHELKALGRQALDGAATSAQIARLAARLTSRLLDGARASFEAPATDGSATAAVASMAWRGRRGGSVLTLPLAGSRGPDDPRNPALLERQLGVLQRTARGYDEAFERVLGSVAAIVDRIERRASGAARPGAGPPRRASSARNRASRGA